MHFKIPGRLLAGIESMYYDALETLREHNVPVYRVAYWLEERGIPSMYVFLAVFAAICVALFCSQMRTYELVVYGPDGAPVPGISVVVDGKEFVTDSSGRILLTGVPRDVNVPMVGVVPKYDPDALSVTLVPVVKEVAIVVGPDGVPQPTVQVSGRGVATFTGRFVTVRLSTLPLSDAIQVDDDGTISITVTADGYRPVVRTISWDALSQRDEIRIDLDKKGTPRSEVRVRTNPAFDGYIYILKSGIETRYRGVLRNGYGVVRGIPYGVYTVRVVPIVAGKKYVDADGRNDVNVVVDSGQEDVEVNAYVPSDHGLSLIRVVDASTGNPIPGAKVRLGSMLLGVTDSSGRVSVLPSTDGNVEIAIDADGYNGVSVLLAPGTSNTVRLSRVEDPGALRVNVYDFVGLPVAGARVVVKDGSGKQVEGVTDSNGAVLLTGLAPGKCLLRVLSADESKISVKHVVVRAGATEHVDVTIAPIQKVAITTVVHDTQGQVVGVPAAVRIILWDSGQIIWEGSTGADGRVVVDVPQYSSVIIHARVDLRGVPYEYYSRPYVVLPGTSIAVDFSERADQFDSLMTEDLVGVLSLDVNATYYGIVRVACEGNCSKEVVESGLEVLGVDSTVIPARTRSDGNTKVVVASCRGVCIYYLPLVIRATSPGCHTAFVGNAEIIAPAGVQIPECADPVCLGTAIPSVIRAAVPERFAVAAVSESAAELQLSLDHSDNIVVSADPLSCTQGDLSFSYVAGTFGAYRPGSEELFVTVESKGATVQKEFGIRVLPSDVAPPELKGNLFFTPLKGCDPPVTVWVESNVAGGLLYTIVMGNDVRTYLAEPGDPITFAVPSGVSTVSVRVEGTNLLPVERNIHRRFWVDVLEPVTVSLASYDPNHCASVPVSVDNNVYSLFDSPYGRPAVEVYCRVWSESNRLVARTWQNLAVAESILVPDTREITVCASATPNSGADVESGMVAGESMNWRIMYRLVADKSVQVGGRKCNPVGDWEAAFLDAMGMGKCLKVTVSGPMNSKGIIVLTEERHAAKISVYLTNTCAETPVDAEITVSTPSGMDVLGQTDVHLAPLERRRISLDVRVSDPVELVADSPVGYVVVDVSYTAEGYEPWAVEDRIPFVYYSPDLCFHPSISYDPLEGVLIDLNVSCAGIRACPTAVFVGDGVVGDIPDCKRSTAHLPAEKIIPILFTGKGDNVLLGIDAFAEWPDGKTPTIRVSSDKVPVNIVPVDINEMLVLGPGCMVRNDTPFLQGVMITTDPSSSSASAVLVPPKSARRPPPGGASVDLCSGKITAEVFAVFESGAVSIGSCEFNVVPPSVFLTGLAGVVNFDQEFGNVPITYRPTAEPPAYAVMGGRVVDFGLPYTYACTSVPCDWNRVCTEALYWMANAGKGEHIVFSLATMPPGGVFSLIRCGARRRYAPDGTFYAVGATHHGRGKYTISVSHADLDKNITYEVRDANVSLTYVYSVEAVVKNDCPVVFMVIRDVNADGKFVEVKCKYDQHLADLRDFIGNSAETYRALVAALVTPSEQDPIANTALDAYPVLALASTEVNASYRGVVPVPVSSAEGISPLYVFGIGRVSTSRVVGTCEPTMPLWTLEPSMGGRISPFTGEANLILVRDRITPLPIGITTVDVWRSVVNGFYGMPAQHP